MGSQNKTYLKEDAFSGYVFNPQLRTVTLQFIKGVGPYISTVFTKLKIHNVLDIMYTFPKRYEDRRTLPTIASVYTEKTAMILGWVQSVQFQQTKSKMVLTKALLSDQSGSIVCVWFNQPFLKDQLKKNKHVLVKGKVQIAAFGERQLLVTEYEIYDSEEQMRQNVGAVMPVYDLSQSIKQTRMRAVSKEILKRYLAQLADPLAGMVRDNFHLLPLAKAIELLHFPTSKDSFDKARSRLVFDEFFLMQLHVLSENYSAEKKQRGVLLMTDGVLIKRFESVLPFTLTMAQNQAIQDIKTDVYSHVAMNRLLQGDVGSGKTIVAVHALLFAIDSGFKGALMAPTEILAEQHFYRLTQFLQPLGVRVLLLKGKTPKAKRRALLTQFKDPEPLVIVGTHALIQDGVDISKLGMVVIDEQHRFGVYQRSLLRQKGSMPHCLYLTATPIPRSLLLTVYGDLDKSIIRELPVGRQPIRSYYFKEDKIDDIYLHCNKEIAKGRQVYIVFPLIEESEKIDLKAVVDEWETLQKTVFSEYQVGVLHGRLTANEKKQTMDDFSANKLQILVCTTVIEVGIDVPNATVMVIHHAERFGLAQLHQLRGRIGRGKERSSCFFIADPRTASSNQRLKALVETTDGFKIAEHDLAIRGPGDVLGKRQAGLPQLHMADLIQDEALLLQARTAVKTILNKDPELNLKEFEAIRMIKQQSKGSLLASGIH